MRNYILFLLLILSFAITAETVNIAPSSDMYTDVEHPDQPNVITELWTANFTPSGQFQRINIDFDIAEYLTSSFQSAVLNLTRFYSCVNGGSTVMRIHPIAEAWTEDSWNAHQHISYHEEIYLETLLSGPGGISIKQFNIDLTDVLNQVIARDLDFYGFVLIANNNQKFSKFYSKEFSNTNYRPSLDITTQVVSNDEVEFVATTLSITSYPNPFNPTTTIEFVNPKSLRSSISIYDLRGRLVTTLNNSINSGGKSQVVWEGTDSQGRSVSSGLYFCKVNLGNDSQTHKLILQK